jgi:hypothetical protein
MKTEKQWFRLQFNFYGTAEECSAVAHKVYEDLSGGKITGLSQFSFPVDDEN